MQDPIRIVPPTAQGKAHPSTHATAPPQLLIPWPSRTQVFVDNLLDLLLFRQPPKVWITARPARFWPDVFVEQRLPWGRLASSGLYHMLLVALVYVITLNWPRPVEIKRFTPNDGTTLTYYSVSDYLPAVDTGKRDEQRARNGEPALAKQRIRSMPPAPDNFRQTIVTPDPTKITQDIPLPNLVANTVIPAPPEASVMQPMSRMTAPPAPQPVAPPPNVQSMRSALIAPPAPEVIGPPVDPSQVQANSRLPNVPGPEIVGPPPSLDRALDRAKLNLPAPAVIAPPVGGNVQRSIGTMNVAHANITVGAPKLPVVEQSAASALHPGAGRARAGSGGRAPVAPPSVAAVSGAVPGTKNAGQLLALNVHPVAVSGPVMVPRGSRSGEFEASPEGKPNAPGTPNVVAGTDGATGNGSSNGHSGAPPGITVSPAPEPPPGPVVASAPPQPLPSTKMLPALRPMSVADLARNTRRVPPLDSPDSKPDEVFGTKKYYSMTLNMPSVTSMGGSCIIRFAELNDRHAGGELTAPVAMLKVDPAYPEEEMRDRVEGTVTLYAVIHKDGTVGEVRVLHGVDKVLDHNAQVALSRWQFRPATRNGTAVDLEAVVQIPFVARKKPF